MTCLTAKQAALLRDVAEAIVCSGYATYASDSKKRIDIFLQDVDIESEKFKRLYGREPTRLELSQLLGISRSQLTKLINRGQTRVKRLMRCDVCQREKMYKYVRPCRVCGGWMLAVDTTTRTEREAERRLKEEQHGDRA